MIRRLVRAPWDPALVTAVGVVLLVVTLWVAGAARAPNARAAGDDVDTRAVDAPLAQLRARWDAEYAALRKQVRGLAVSDATYEFVRRPNFPYVDEHYGPDALRALGVDTVLVVDAKSRPVFWRRPNDPDNRGFEDAEEFLAQMPPLPPPASRRARGEPVVEGLVQFRGAPQIVTAIAIEPPRGDGAPRGYLIHGRAIDGAVTKRVLQDAAHGLDVMRPDDALLPGEVRLRLERSLTPVVVADEQRIRGYLPLVDLQGRPLRIYATSAPRPAHAKTAPASPPSRPSWSLVVGSVIVLLLVGGAGWWWTAAPARRRRPGARDEVERLARALARETRGDRRPSDAHATPGMPQVAVAEALVGLGVTADDADWDDEPRPIRATATRDGARDAPRDATRDATRDAARDVAREPAREGERGAPMAAPGEARADSHAVSSGHDDAPVPSEIEDRVTELRPPTDGAEPSDGTDEWLVGTPDDVFADDGARIADALDTREGHDERRADEYEYSDGDGWFDTYAEADVDVEPEHAVPEPTEPPRTEPEVAEPAAAEPVEIAAAPPAPVDAAPPASTPELSPTPSDEPTAPVLEASSEIVDGGASVAPEPSPVAATSGPLVRGLLEQGRLRVHYQPQVSTSSGEIVGVEALVRWEDEDAVLRTARELFGNATTADVFADATEFVLRRACADRRAWLKQVGRTLPVSVNVGLGELRAPGFVARVLRILEEADLPSGFLELEVPEAALSHADSPEARALDEAYRAGLGIAVGGFVAADAPLRALTQVPVAKLKLHRSLVADLPDDANARAVIDTILAVGRTLGVVVCAEGVETKAQAAYLERKMCPLVQGWHYAKPMDADDFLALLRGTGSDTVRLPLMDVEELEAHARAAGVV